MREALRHHATPLRSRHCALLDTNYTSSTKGFVVGIGLLGAASVLYCYPILQAEASFI